MSMTKENEKGYVGDAIDLRQHLSKLNVRPGDVLTLHLDETYEDMGAECMARVNAKAEATIREACGFEDVRVLVVPPGAKLKKGEPRRLGCFRVSRELLAAWLGLPGGARIDAITQEAFFATNQIGIRVEHDAIPAVLTGDYLPCIEPTVTAGKVSHRIDWDANGVMPGVEPTIRPDAAKITALLRRVSEEFGRIGGDAVLHGEVCGAILELNDLIDPAFAPEELRPRDVPSPQYPLIKGLTGVVGGCNFTDGALFIDAGSPLPSTLPGEGKVEASEPECGAECEPEGKVNFREFL